MRSLKISVSVIMCDYKTGDLIVVESYTEPRVFLYYTNVGDVAHQSKPNWDIATFNLVISKPHRVSKYIPKKYVKDAVTIMKWLVDNGYRVSPEGNWSKEGEPIGFVPKMWFFC